MLVRGRVCAPGEPNKVSAENRGWRFVGYLDVNVGAFERSERKEWREEMLKERGSEIYWQNRAEFCRRAKRLFATPAGRFAKFRVNALLSIPMCYAKLAGCAGNSALAAELRNSQFPKLENILNWYGRVGFCQCLLQLRAGDNIKLDPNEIEMRNRAVHV